MPRDHFRSSPEQVPMFESEEHCTSVKKILGVFLTLMLIGSCVSGKDLPRESPSPDRPVNPVKIHVWQGGDTRQRQKIHIFIEQILKKRDFNISDYNNADILVAIRDVTDDELPSHAVASYQKKRVVHVQIIVVDGMNKDLLPDIKGVESRIMESIREEIAKEDKLTNINPPLAESYFLYLDLF